MNKHSTLGNIGLSIDFVSSLESELWLPIAGHEYRYMVSNIGRVVSIAYEDSSGLSRKARIRKPYLTKGYFLVHLVSNKGIRKARSVHRFVAEAFILNPENKPQVNHKNDIKTDNSVENLEWATLSENVKHAIDNGLIPSGCDNHKAKLNVCQVRKARELLKLGYSDEKIAAMLGVTHNVIFCIKHGISYKNVY